MAKVQKQVVPYNDLLDKIRDILRSYPECRNFHIDRIETYPEHRDGANWDVMQLTPSGDDDDRAACWHKIMREISDLHKYYDIEPPPDSSKSQ